MSKAQSVTERRYNAADKHIKNYLKLQGITPECEIYQRYEELRDWAYELGKLAGKEELRDAIFFEVKQEVERERERWEGSK